MYARLNNVDVKTDRIYSNLLLVYLQYRQITKMPVEKQTVCCSDLFCAVFSWCYVPAATVNWHIKATKESWQRIKVIQHTIMLQTYTQIKRTLLPKSLFRVKATSQGFMTIFLQLCQTCSKKLIAFLLVLWCWSLKTQSFPPCINVLCNQTEFKWFIWILQRCNNLLYLYVARHEWVLISQRPLIPTVEGY